MDGSFQSLYEQQFGPPVFQRTGIGAPEFDSSSWSTSLILSDVADLYKSFCFRDDEATIFHTPEERYRFLSDDERVCSFLACVKFIQGADPVTNAPIFGAPVLTVIHAPAVALSGQSISGEEAWPDAPSFSPLKLRVPDGPLYFLAGSIAASSRIFSSSPTMQCTRSAYLESIVLGLEDLSTFSLGWTIYDGQISPSSRPFATTAVAAIPDSVVNQFFGGERPVSLHGTQHGVYIPKLFPLPAKSGLAASQLYDPTLGAAEFVNAVLEQATGASPEVRTCLQWLSVFQPLRAFLDAVQHDPAAFAIPLVARSSIIDSLRGDHADFPLVSSSSLAPVHWAINSTVWRMHNDYIRATCRDNVIASYDLYLSRAAQSMLRPGGHDYPFGKSPATMNPALPVLRPPRPKNWSEGKFRLHAYMAAHCAPPLAEDFRVVKVSTTQGQWEIPPLETEEEFEEQLALQQPSPDSARLFRRMRQSQYDSSRESPNPVRQQLFPPAGGSLPVRLQQFSTGSPLDRPPTSSGPVVTDSRPPTQTQTSQQHDRVGASTTGTSYDARLQAILEGHDSAHLDRAGHLQQDHNPLRSDPLSHVPPASNSVSNLGSSAASQPLGLGIATVENVQDPIVASLTSVQHDRHQSHLFSTAVTGDARFGLAAALHGSVPDDGYLGASKRLRMDDSASALFRRGDPETFRFDVERRRGPDSFFFFSVLLCFHAPIAAGQFLALLSSPVPPSWSLAPATLGLEWLRNHVCSSASSNKAYTWLRSSIFALTQQGTMGAWQPAISEAFYDPATFKLYTDASCWATWELENVADLKSHFTALHFVTSLPGITQPLFPSEGLSWEQCIQLLTNVIGLFRLALWDYGLPMPGTPSIPFLVNLDTLLRLVSSNDVRLSWSSAPRNYTVATYKLLVAGSSVSSF
jgi:hypothetical protein